ncbi:MAG: hypothetical protein KKH75_07330, partial [Actinobacteria bacterium]|nr:hypothetical protein [Actinomycetota bacterium]
MSPVDGHGGERLAPVTYLPGVAPAAAPRSRPTVSFTDSSWVDEAPASESETADATVTSFEARVSVADDDDTAHDADIDHLAVVARASASLTRSLGRRGLSVAEARSKLRGDGVSSDEVEDVID